MEAGCVGACEKNKDCAGFNLTQTYEIWIDFEHLENKHKTLLQLEFQEFAHSKSTKIHEPI